MIRNDPKIESTCGSGNVIGRGGDGDRAHKTCDYDTHLTRRRSLTHRDQAVHRVHAIRSREDIRGKQSVGS